jgi:hypothetical protein
MQKVINALALASFGVSAVVVGSGVWIYANRFALINDVKNIVAEEVTEMIPIIAQEILPSTDIKSAVPGGTELPIQSPSLPF